MRGGWGVGVGTTSAAEWAAGMRDGAADAPPPGKAARASGAGADSLGGCGEGYWAESTVR